MAAGADFTSALYLGFRHLSGEDWPGEPLSIGKPAALEDPPGAAPLETGLAQLLGCQAAVVAPSTFHLFWDVCSLFGRNVSFVADRAVYPIARWGLERAAALGRPVQWFDHHDPVDLARALALSRRQPVVVADGFCIACGKPAPLRAYRDAVQSRGGLLLIDDTQAVGILGDRSGGGHMPYGNGGGGSIRFHGIEGEDVLTISSLSKAFGAPLAVFAGARGRIRAFREESETRVHCSPPSTAAIRAGLGALDRNRREGDALRSHLAALVREFRLTLARVGVHAGADIRPTGGWFPIQSMEGPGLFAVESLLRRAGVRAVLQRGRDNHSTRLSFVLTALHDTHDLEFAGGHLARACRQFQCSEGTSHV